MAKFNVPRLILASGSAVRAKMLRDVGLDFEVIPADIDEEILQNSGAPPRDIALELSKAKALHIAKQYPDALVIGADQVLGFEGDILSKALGRDEAIAKLRRLKGKAHSLISAVTVAKGELVLWQESDEAHLSMRDFDGTFLHGYLNAAGEGLTRAVGAYELEGAGAWLFERVEGSYFTVLGLPLLPLLGYLKDYQGAGP